MLAYAAAEVLGRDKIMICSDAAKSSGVIGKRVDLCVPLSKKTNTPPPPTKNPNKTAQNMMSS